MTLFIAMNLFFGIFLMNNTLDAFLFLTDYFQYLGTLLIILSFIAIGWKRLKTYSIVKYDFFAVGTVLIWSAYWPPFFREGSPIFYVFPLYFSLISAVLSLLFTSKRNQLSAEVINDLKMISGFWLSNPLIIMVFVIISLALPQYFMLFPIMLTLFIIRFSLASCLDNE